MKAIFSFRYSFFDLLLVGVLSGIASRGNWFLYFALLIIGLVFSSFMSLKYND